MTWSSATTVVLAASVLTWAVGFSSAAALGAVVFVIAAYCRRGPDDTLPISVLRLINAAYALVIHRLRVAPAGDPVPTSGPSIVVANHRSSADPFLVTASTKRWVRFLMAREYYRPARLFRFLQCIPVRRDGRDLAATRQALRALKAARVVGIFPQGGIRSSAGGLEVDKAGVALLALRSGAPVVPLYITGSSDSDSVFRGLLTPSRSVVRWGKPLFFGPSHGKPTRDQLDAVTARIVSALLELQRRSLEEGEASSEMEASPSERQGTTDGESEPRPSDSRKSAAPHEG